MDNRGIDNRTENLGLPLPNADNRLMDDFQRIANAFIMLDAKARAQT